MPALDHDRAPLAEAVARHLDRRAVRLHMPGHKGRRPAGFPADLFAADLTELPGLDDLRQPEGPIALGQALSADLWGAEATFWCTGGSTSGLAALILASCPPGSRLLVSRHAHRSVWAGLVWSGAEPDYIPSTVLDRPRLPAGFRLDVVEQRLASGRRPAAVLLVRPTYQGLCPDLRPVSALCRRSGVPLLVDEAHGPLLGLGPEQPASALAHGADAVVQSLHKTAGALNSAACVHLRGDRVDRERLAFALRALETSSPSYPVLLSIDLARRRLAQDHARWREGGRSRLGELARAAARAAAEIGGISGWGVLGRAQSGLEQDPLKLVVLPPAAWSGFEVARRLAEDVGQGGQFAPVDVEMAGPDHALAMLGIGSRAADLRALVAGIERLVSSAGLRPSEAVVESVGRAHHGQTESPTAALRHPWPTAPDPIVRALPREAFFAPRRRVPRQRAIGACAGEVVAPYPPGVPWLLPGEVITAEILDGLDALRLAGARLQGPADPTLAELAILA